jgi:hypothetical protein
MRWHFRNILQMQVHASAIADEAVEFRCGFTLSDRWSYRAGHFFSVGQPNGPIGRKITARQAAELLYATAPYRDGGYVPLEIL